MTHPTHGDLTPEQQADLSVLEAVVDCGIVSFVETGNALARISDERLYRATHDTFELYVNARYQMTARRAYQFCEAAKVVNLMVEENVNHGSQITNERQARELAKAPAEKRGEVLQKASEKSGGKPTAKDIQAEVEQLTAPQPQDEAWKSAMGATSIPQDEPTRLEIALKDLGQLVDVALEELEAKDLPKFKLELEVQARRVKETQRRSA